MKVDQARWGIETISERHRQRGKGSHLPLAVLQIFEEKFPLSRFPPKQRKD